METCLQTGACAFIGRADWTCAHATRPPELETEFVRQRFPRLCAGTDRRTFEASIAMAKWQGGLLQLSPSLMAEGSIEMTGFADSPEWQLWCKVTGLRI